MVSKMAPANMPLRCNLCYKASSFSDLSHLLTHCLSKGHLAQHQKFRLRAEEDPEAKARIEAYTKWKETYGVDKLMAERVKEKEKKRAKQRASAPGSRRSTPLPSTLPLAFPPALPSALPGYHPQSGGDTIYPHIPLPFVKLEPPGTPPQAFPYGGTAIDGTFGNGGVAPSMQSWPTMSHVAPFSTQGFDSTSSETSDKYTTASVSVTDESPYSIEETDDMIVLEHNKLKGIIYEGMGIFDSATPEMRRKRNQKKDNSVVAQLESNSFDVDALEMVFSPKGTFRKTRKISGLPCSDDEGSDFEGSPEPIPPPRRQALASWDPNRPKTANSIHNTRGVPGITINVAAANGHCDSVNLQNPSAHSSGRFRRSLYFPTSGSLPGSGALPGSSSLPGSGSLPNTNAISGSGPVSSSVLLPGSGTYPRPSIFPRSGPTLRSGEFPQDGPMVVDGALIPTPTVSEVLGFGPNSPRPDFLHNGSIKQAMAFFNGPSPRAAEFSLGDPLVQGDEYSLGNSMPMQHLTSGTDGKDLRHNGVTVSGNMAHQFDGPQPVMLSSAQQSYHQGASYDPLLELDFGDLTSSTQDAASSLDLPPTDSISSGYEHAMEQHDPHIDMPGFFAHPSLLTRQNVGSPDDEGTLSCPPSEQ
ncbi:hypothetical protein BDY21DRAFT_40712 [Lineolata rhizophorae]|uniref:Uncharacterized protein n=1 Tax=Lineolata rhizophorae TaxID=578093 RepID=A0A6A6NZP2_9PEZI|nr:hypothetical protein BDY21DRAFT_40712 [Lineolata rhizophorae]